MQYYNERQLLLGPGKMSMLMCWGIFLKGDETVVDFVRIINSLK